MLRRRRRPQDEAPQVPGIVPNPESYLFRGLDLDPEEPKLRQIFKFFNKKF